jgi:hypothetical protein
VLTRFVAPVEVLTDRGVKFEVEFAKMLMECYIDHRTTSADHPQTDGLAEKDDPDYEDGNVETQPQLWATSGLGSKSTMGSDEL